MAWFYVQGFLDDRALAHDALTALRRRPSRFTLPDGSTVRIPKAAVDGLMELLPIR